MGVGAAGVQAPDPYMTPVFLGLSVQLYSCQGSTISLSTTFLEPSWHSYCPSSGPAGSLSTQPLGSCAHSGEGLGLSSVCLSVSGCVSEPGGIGLESPPASLNCHIGDHLGGPGVET